MYDHLSSGFGLTPRAAHALRRSMADLPAAAPSPWASSWSCRPRRRPICWRRCPRTATPRARCRPPSNRSQRGVGRRRHLPAQPGRPERRIVSGRPATRRSTMRPGPRSSSKPLAGARGQRAGIRIRADSGWNVPEPEMVLVINRGGEIVGYCAGNDMSSRDIEGENPLYLPQAKDLTTSGPAPLGSASSSRARHDLRNLPIRIEIVRGSGSRFSAARAARRRCAVRRRSWLPAWSRS